MCTKLNIFGLSLLVGLTTHAQLDEMKRMQDHAPRTVNLAPLAVQPYHGSDRSSNPGRAEAVYETPSSPGRRIVKHSAVILPDGKQPSESKPRCEKVEKNPQPEQERNSVQLQAPLKPYVEGKHRNSPKRKAEKL